MVIMTACTDKKEKAAVLGPEETAEAFCRAVASGDMDRAYQLCDTVMMKGYLDAWTETCRSLEQKDSSALRIASDILSESVFTLVEVGKDGDRRSVTYRLESEGQSKTRKATLRKEEGKWKVESLTDGL